MSLLLLCALHPAIPFQETTTSTAERVDAAIEARALERGLELAHAASESEILRRLWLDLAGRVPGALEAREFYRGDRSTDTLVERLLAREEFADHWARFLLETTTERRAAQDEEHNGRKLFEYFSSSIRERKPYDRIVRELLTAEGSMNTNGAANWILRYGARAPDLAGAVGRAFLGTSLQCAQCHDHPYTTWKQDDFWSLAAYFSKTRPYYVYEPYEIGVTEVRDGLVHMPPGGDPNALLEEEAALEAEAADEGAEGEGGEGAEEEMAAASSSPPLRPRFLDDSYPDPESTLREDLARRVTASPTFARNLVNRVWARLIGAPFVEPLDELWHEPSHPEALAALEERFVASGGDLTELVRTIVSTRTYRRSSADEGRSGGERDFAHALLRPLSPDQLIASVQSATGWNLDEDGSGWQDDPSVAAMSDEERVIYVEQVLDYLDYYVPDLAGGEGRTLRRSLVTMNSEHFHAAADSLARLTMKLFGQPAEIEHVEWMYLATLARLPEAGELEAARALLAESEMEGWRHALEDLAWALLNSIEFQNNH